jgi:phenylalanyl-tRNA synthetase alpha chain
MVLEKLAGLDKEAQAIIAALNTIEELNEYKVKMLGRKGEITALLRGLKDLSPEQRAEVGKAANEIKDKLEAQFNSRANEIIRRDRNIKLQQEKIDVTLPGLPMQSGSIHPLTRIRREITGIFTGMGFTVEEGPEIELDYYNFEALNVPKHHPARDMQDSFYITDEVLLRTHTSPVQVRTMEKMVPQIPVKIIVPGTVYRNDDDATIHPCFTR